MRNETMHQRGDLGDLLRARGASQSVLTFIQRLLAAATTNPLLLGESAMACRTAAHTTRIADEVIQHWHSTGKTQPFPQWVQGLHTDASEACHALLGTAPVPVVQGWLRRLGPGHNHSQTPIILPGEGQAFVEQIVGVVHDDPTLNRSALDHCALEIAALMIGRQQSPRAVADALVQALSTKASAAISARELIVRELAYSERPHAVLLGVSGARDLPGLDTAHPRIAMRQVYPHQRQQFAGWGNAGDRAQTFLRGLAAGSVDTGQVTPRSTSPHAFISVHLDAPDVDAAIARARVAVSEALDQYVVAHPSARLAIEPVAAAADPVRAGSFVIVDERGKPIDDLRPVVAPWPSRLRIGLRMTSLMRTSSTAVTRSALCWVTLESSGLKATTESRQTVARALAMALLRQTYFRAYRDLVSAVSANSEARRRHEHRSAVLRRSARKHLRIDPSIPAAARLRLGDLRRAAAAVLHARLAVMAEQEAQRRRAMLLNLAVEKINPVESPSARLTSFRKWAELLRRNAAEAPSSISALSLTSLLSTIAPYQRSTINMAQAMAVDPAKAADFLQARQAWIQSLAAQLYVFRNLHLHNGVHEVAGSNGLGMIGPMMVDLLFEVWAAWYEAGSQLAPTEILDQLAQRFDACTNSLSRGVLLEDLDIARLTGPVWNPQNP